MEEAAGSAPDRPVSQQTRVATRRAASAWRSGSRPLAATVLADDALTDDAPEKTDKCASRPLPVAAMLLNALDAAAVRYGIIQDIAGLTQALAGADDIDLFLDRRDYAAFCSIVGKLHGLPGTSLSCYDNVCAGREDWFLPDFANGRYLHLDVHVGIRIGWEFRKRYLKFERISMSGWERVAIGELRVPIVPPDVEIRMAICRFAFGNWAPPWRRWIALRGEWTGVLSRHPRPDNGRGHEVVTFAAGGGRVVNCRMRRRDGKLFLHRGDLGTLQRSIREECGFSGPGFVDFAVHLARKTSYRILRLLGRARFGGFPPKRRPVNGGLVVAVVGPDGVGKSTQVDRLTRTFGWKFGCLRDYAGTGDGKGWWFRKLLARLVAERKTQLKSAVEHIDEMPGGRSLRSELVAAGFAFWAILIALERYAKVKRAHRSATRGFVVISDRWPQALQRGYLDGPMIPPGPHRLPGLNALFRLELELYEKMQRMPPHLTFHLVADYSTSRKRKPGEIKREAFDARLSLMERLRNRDGDIRLIDANASVDAVARDLFRQIWLSL